MRSTRRRFIGQTNLAAAWAATGAAFGASPQDNRGSHRGIAMTIGLNHVSSTEYPGAPELRGCINDVSAIDQLAKLQGFECMPTLTDDKATAAAVIKTIKDAASTLGSADIFLIQYSGHGGQVPDLNGDETDDHLDETWCLYDRQLVDDELANLWRKFKDGVRILIISDSCHSGTVDRGRGYVEDLKAGGTAARGGGDKEKVMQGLLGDEAKPVFRFMPDAVLQRNYQAHENDYKKISDELEGVRDIGLQEKGPSIVLLSGCQDNQLSGDLTSNGVFTSRLLQVWGDGKYKERGYKEFVKRIVALMPASQTPNLDLSGAPNLKFWLERPFTI
jgi:metacaspase-1